MQLRFHAQTAGVSLTAQQPEVNLVRTAVEALAAVLGGTQSLHTNSMDETMALPTDKAARLALRTQQVLAFENRVANVADPLGGSWYVEALTDEMERLAEAIFEQLDGFGDGSMLEGVLRAVESGWFQRNIADSAYELERKTNSGHNVVVGVTDFFEGNEEAPPELLRIGPEFEDRQLKRLAALRADRDDERVDKVLARVRADAAEPTTNVLPALIEAVQGDATLGEIVNAFAEVFGRYTEAPMI
jgi:methylmalonyl-CoA mutase N-terminal domain/subunit